MNAIAKTDVGSDLANVILNGDMSKLSPQDKIAYYNNVCASMGINPFTQPFEYMRLNGKELLYAKRSCADQLRQVHGITLEIVSKGIEDELYIVAVRATNKAGRTDEDLGVVTISGLKGEARANAILKAITKAKRRVTLSICGLGMLDETEVESIKGAQTFAAPTIFTEPVRSSVAIAAEMPAMYEPDALRDKVDWLVKALAALRDDQDIKFTGLEASAPRLLAAIEESGRRDADKLKAIAVDALSAARRRFVKETEPREPVDADYDANSEMETAS